MNRTVDSQSRADLHSPECALTQEAELASCVTREFLHYHRICPIRVLDDGILLAATDNTTISTASAELEIAYGRRVLTVTWPPERVQVAIERLMAHASGASRHSNPQVADATDARGMADQPPVIRYVSLLVRDGQVRGASDIHIEATPHGLTARYRIDGIMQPAIDPPGGLEDAIVSRIKLLAELDIAERRRPQDGRFYGLAESRNLDIRVSCVPNLYGESIVLRLLNHEGERSTLADLGVAADTADAIRMVATRPSGLMVATGPTGSGKSTTLYALLGYRDVRKEKILTLEDPVERPYAGAVQIPVNEQIGVTFASMLRSMLRQDPDVLLVGEMRDSETARLVVQAALTGHYVLSTLHTVDAVSAVLRLSDLGVAPYLIAATLDGILAQRLVRLNCPECRVSYTPRASALETLDLPPGEYVRGIGCTVCSGSGFRGRVGIFEFLPVTESFRDGVAGNAPRQVLRSLARNAEVGTLVDDGRRKVRAGVTTPEEVLRVTQS